MVVAKLRIEGRRSPAADARLATFARTALITQVVFEPMRFVMAPSVAVLARVARQFIQIALNCRFSRKMRGLHFDQWLRLGDGNERPRDCVCQTCVKTSQK